MRQSLRKSLADAPGNFEGYAAGSIVICNGCSLPLYKLDRSIGIGQKAGRGASAFKPVSLQDLADLAERRDIEAGFLAKLHEWPLEQRHAHIRLLTEPKSGDPMMCPACGGAWPQVLSTERQDTADRAYVLELVTIPPKGHRVAPLTGRKNLWLHSEGALQ